MVDATADLAFEDDLLLFLLLLLLLMLLLLVVTAAASVAVLAAVVVSVAVLIHAGAVVVFAVVAAVIPAPVAPSAAVRHPVATFRPLLTTSFQHSGALSDFSSSIASAVTAVG